MSIHMQTGHGIDVVYDWEGRRRVLKGIYPYSRSELIPLTDIQAEALVEGLTRILKENKEINNATESTDGNDSTSEWYGSLRAGES